MEMMLDKKQIQVIFLLFKMVHQAAETTHKINSAFSPGTAKEHKVQWWFQRLLKGDESLEDEKQSDWPSGVNNDQLRASSKLILLQLHKKLLKNPASIMFWPFSIWSKLERWKSLISGCLMSWPQIKKIFILNPCLLLFYATIMNHFSIRLWHVTKGRFYIYWQWSAQCLEQDDVPKHFPNQNCTKKRAWSLLGGLLSIWSIIAFWIPEKPVYLRSMLSKLICTENCNSCQWHWSTERAQFFSLTTPNHRSHNQHFKSLMNGATKFCLFCHIHLTFPKLTTIFSSISTTFYRENASITSRRQKMLSNSLSKPGAWIFTQ